MALLLIMGVNQRMPSVTEWRTHLNSVAVPTAQAWLAANPLVPQGIADYERWLAYQQALAANDLAAITAYEINPLSPDALAYAQSLYRWRHEQVNPHDRAPLVDIYRYYRRVLDVEVYKTDLEKSLELAEKDQRGCYKAGDIVDVYEDSQHDGDISTNPIAHPFYLVRILGVTKPQVLKYLEPEVDLNDVTKRIRRRRYRLDVDTVPAAIKTALQATRYIEVTKTQIQNYLLDKQTGLAA